MVDPVYSGAVSVVHPQTTLISTIKTLSDYENPRVLQQKYVVEGLSLSRVAESIGSSKSSVRNNLRRFKIPIRESNRNQGCSANPPYGYHLKGGGLVEHTKEKKVIKTIVKMYSEEKLSMNAIARALTADQVPTKKGKALWHHEMVRSILKREKII